MDDLRKRLMSGDLVQDVRHLVRRGAAIRGEWLRKNIRHALRARREDPAAVSTLTGLAPGTVSGFLGGRSSSVDNVLLIAEAVGYPLAELDRPPEQFEHHVHARRDGGDANAFGASLLAFDESPLAMAVVLIDGTIVKVSRQLLKLLGYEEGELIGASAAAFWGTSGKNGGQPWVRLAAADAVHGHESTFRHKDGSLLPSVVSTVVVRDEDGQTRYVIARATRADAADGAAHKQDPSDDSVGSPGGDMPSV
jgi:PAS domain S-box-containing protein